MLTILCSLRVIVHIRDSVTDPETRSHIFLSYHRTLNPLNIFAAYSSVKHFNILTAPWSPNWPPIKILYTYVLFPIRTS